MQFLQPIYMYFSAYKQKIQCTFSGSKQILDQNISVYSGDYREPPNEKKSKNFNFKPLNFRKNSNFN